MAGVGPEVNRDARPYTRVKDKESKEDHGYEMALILELPSGG